MAHVGAEELYRVPKEQASALLRLAFLIPFAQAIVGDEGRRGIRFVFFRFLAIESYTCYQEPILGPWRGIRFVLWKTKKGVVVSPGWRRFRGVPIGNTFAVAPVHQDFLKTWSGNARRLVSKQQYDWRRVSLEEFSAAYHASGYLDLFLRHAFIKVIKDHLRVHPEDVSLLFFFHQGVLLGGTVFVDHPDIQQSHYLISFLTESGKTAKAGYAFIHWWYQDMLKKGLQWADFGIVWAPGDPASWKGYSQFKKRFNPLLITRVAYWKFG